MIIDFRLRPPFGGFRNSWLYNIEETSRWAARFNMEISESAKQFSLELCLQEMKNAGIEKAVVPIRRSENIENADLVKLIDDYSEQFIGFIGIDPLEENAVQMIDELVLQGKCKGIVIEPGYCGEGILMDDECNFEIYKKCEENDILMLVSYGGLTAPNQDFMKPIYVDHVAEKFPDLRMVICHAAWPWVTQMCQVALARKNVYISPDIYMINNPGASDYIAAANYMLTEKILYGSAYPAVSMEQAANYFKNCGIRKEVLADLMYHNAAKLLGLE